MYCEANARMAVFLYVYDLPFTSSLSSMFIAIMNEYYSLAHQGKRPRTEQYKAFGRWQDSEDLELDEEDEMDVVLEYDSQAFPSVHARSLGADSSHFPKAYQFWMMKNQCPFKMVN
jgi:hypothetical protein